MKKLGFILAFVFAASFVIAQHTSTVLETGDGNTATVTQAFSAGPMVDGNISTIDQDGDNNDAIVNQITNGFGGQGHESEIYQTGNLNDASVEQRNATGNAIIDQIGNNNIANVLESGNFGTPYPIPALDPYDAWVYQEGEGNEVNMSIYGDGSSAYAKQVGNDNEILQQIGQGPDNTNIVNSSSAFADQNGDDNYASQIMQGQGSAGLPVDVAFLRERIWQEGNRNVAYQLQTDIDIPAGPNYASADQAGDDNYSLQEQTGQQNDSRVWQTGNLNDSETFQTGDLNDIDVTQNGPGNNSSVTQLGNDNDVVVQQN